MNAFSAKWQFLRCDIFICEYRISTLQFWKVIKAENVCLLQNILKIETEDAVDVRLNNDDILI